MNEEKRLAGEKAAEFIEDGMTVGLGTGSTVYYTLLKLGKMVENGLRIRGVSTSTSTTLLAKKLGIFTVPLNEVKKIDITIDGADEVDFELNGIKGGGGAFLYEKLVALASEKVVWVIDSSKFKTHLGEFPLPVEVVPFGYKQIFSRLDSMGFNPTTRLAKNNFFVTDGNHYIIDLNLKYIHNAHKLEMIFNSIAGIVDSGLFIEIVDTVVIGREDTVEIINRVRE